MHYQVVTYRSLAQVTFGVADRIVIFCNVQMQEVLVREVLVAFGAPVHVRFLVVDIVGFKRVEGERLVRGQRAPHECRMVGYGRLGVQMHNLDMSGLLVR